MYYKNTCRLSRLYGKYLGWGLLLFVWLGVFSCTFWFVDTTEYSHFGTWIHNFPNLVDIFQCSYCWDWGSIHEDDKFDMTTLVKNVNLR